MNGAPAGAPWRCMLVTDRRRFELSAPALVERARWAALAGVGVIQVREHDLPDRDLVELVRAIVEAAASPCRVVVNDRADIAIAAGASGVHLRADSMPATRVRELLPRGMLLGRSIHSRDDAVAAAGGCDYLLFGTVFPSQGKADGHAVAGLDELREVCRAVPTPVIAIGGIDAARAAAAADGGASGVAAIGAFMAAADARSMRARVDDVRRAFDTRFPGCLQ
ncbi:MAG: thiamine phosphate synthase [Vicinamibacterales bacterium]